MSRLPAHTTVPRRTFAQELGEPRLVLDFLVQNGQSKFVGAVILTGRHVADFGVTLTLDRTALRVGQYREHGLDISRVVGQVGRWAGRDVVEVVYVAGKRAAWFVNARDQGLESS